MFKNPMLNVTGHSIFFWGGGVSPISTRLFCYITCSFKRTSLRLFRFEIAQFFPFWIENPQNLSEMCKKGSNCQILNQNNRRLGRLKVHVIKQQSLVLMGETLQKNLIFEWPVTLSLISSLLPLPHILSQNRFESQLLTLLFMLSILPQPVCLGF